MPNLSAFLSYIILTAYTPGPNNIMAMSNAGKYGFKKALRFCAGMMAGFLVVMVACALFSAALFNIIPQIEPYMKYVGAAYILLLAWTIWRDKPHGKKAAFSSNTFFAGVMLQFVNVKVILYGITAFTTFILPYYKELPTVIFFIAVLTVNGAMAVFCWVLFGAVFQKLFENHKKLMNALMALALVYCAVTAVIH